MKEKIFTNCFLVNTDKDGKPTHVWLAMKKRGFGEGKWNGAGGKTEGEETVHQTAIREAREEFIVEVKEMGKYGEIDFFLKEENKIVHMHTYLVTSWEGSPSETEEMRPQLFPIDGVPYDQMWASDRQWLPLILAGKKIQAKFTYAREGGEVEDSQIIEVPFIQD